MPETKKTRVTVTISEADEKSKKRKKGKDPIREAARIIALVFLAYCVYMLMLQGCNRPYRRYGLGTIPQQRTP